jgi:hypothetical protein
MMKMVAPYTKYFQGYGGEFIDTVLHTGQVPPEGASWMDRTLYDMIPDIIRSRHINFRAMIKILEDRRLWGFKTQDDPEYKQVMMDYIEGEKFIYRTPKEMTERATNVQKNRDFVIEFIKEYGASEYDVRYMPDNIINQLTTIAQEIGFPDLSGYTKVEELVGVAKKAKLALDSQNTKLKAFVSVFKEFDGSEISKTFGLKSGEKQIIKAMEETGVTFRDQLDLFPLGDLSAELIAAESEIKKWRIMGAIKKYGWQVVKLATASVIYFSSGSTSHMWNGVTPTMDFHGPFPKVNGETVRFLHPITGEEYSQVDAYRIMDVILQKGMIVEAPKSQTPLFWPEQLLSTQYIPRK